VKIAFRRVWLDKIFPLRISRGVSARSENLFVSVEQGGLVGLGELAGTNTPGGENCDTGLAELGELIASGIDGLSVTEVYARGREMGIRPRAQAALDMALWDLLAKQAGMPLYRLLGLPLPTVPTSVTIGIETPEVVRERVPIILRTSGAKHLKIKLGSPEGLDADRAMFEMVREVAAPFGVSLRVDANGGWDLAGALTMCHYLADRGVDYVEQPLPQGAETDLVPLFAARPLPIFVDESCNYAADVPALADRVDGVNLKLMKCGGITEALRIVAAARAHGLGTMIGCMGEAHVAISAGAALGALFDHIDLDSQLNLANDPTVGARLVDGVVVPTDDPGHGARFADADS
jgi:muconate cycloisomerase